MIDDVVKPLSLVSNLIMGVFLFWLINENTDCLIDLFN